MNTFGDRLQRLRCDKGFTLQYLADEAGSTKSYIWELENKPNIRPSAELVYRIAIVLSTTVDVLLGEAHENQGELDRVFVRNYQALKPKTKKLLSRIMDVLEE